MVSFFDSFLFSSSVESCRVFVASENYLLLVPLLSFESMTESFGDLNPDWTTGFKLFFLTRFQVIVERLVPSYSNTEIKIMET